MYLAASLALLPGLLPIVTVAWSLSYEVFFYVATAAVVLGLGLGAARRSRRVAALLILAVAFTLLFAC